MSGYKRTYHYYTRKLEKNIPIRVTNNYPVLVMHFYKEDRNYITYGCCKESVTVRNPQIRESISISDYSYIFDEI